MPSGNVQVRLGSGGGASRTVTLVLPLGVAKDLLYALNEVRALEGLKMDWHNRTQLQYVSENLLRMWSR